MFRIGILLKTAKKIRQFSNTSRTPPDYYKILGVKQSASQSEIKEAYYEKTKIYHPDSSQSIDVDSKAFREITEAYEVLGKPKSRKDYDEKIFGVTAADEDGRSAEDIIKNYKRSRISNTKSFDWTREHCENLRMELQNHKISHSYKRDKLDRGLNSPDNFLFAIILFTFVAFFGAVTIYKDKDGESEFFS